MNVTPVSNPLPGEHLNAVAPVMSPQIDAGWGRRLNFWTGRSLTADALQVEQDHRAARIASRGRLISPGVVSGLEASLGARPAPPGAPPGPFATLNLHVMPGYGIGVRGEDVVAPRPLVVPMDKIPVAFLASEDPHPPPAGVFSPGPADQPWFEEFNAGGLTYRVRQADGAAPWAAVLLLRPAETAAFARRDPGDSCEYDPSFDAFSDPRRLDAAQLLLFALPNAWKDALTGAGGAPVGDATWRNRLAYSLFTHDASRSARRQLEFRSSLPQGKGWGVERGDESLLPWEWLGVPLALVSVEGGPPGGAVFLDHGAVVRTGGMPPSRPRPCVSLAVETAGGLPSPPGSGGAPLWRARVEQFAEHLASVNETDPSALASRFAFLPPAGILPKGILDFLTTDQARQLNRPERAASSRFFPSHFQIEAAPVPSEQLDAALASSAPLSAFDLQGGAADRVRILAPMPQNVFDPRLLTVEEPDPFFQAEVARLAAVRQGWRERRDFVRSRADELLAVAVGRAGVAAEPPADPGQLEPEPVEFSADLAPLGVTSALAPPRADPGPWTVSITFAQAQNLADFEIIALRLRPDEEAPPASVEIRWRTDRAEWVDERTTMPPAATQAPTQAAPLWRAFETKASDLRTVGKLLTGVVLVLAGGRAALGGVTARPPSSGTPVAIPVWRPGDKGVAPNPGADWTPVPPELLTTPFEDPFQIAPDDDFTAAVEKVLPELNTELNGGKSVQDAGLAAIINVMEAEAAKADDLVNAHFEMARTNLHQVRRLILGRQEADELLTSPTLGKAVDLEPGLITQTQLDAALARTPTATGTPAPKPAPPPPPANAGAASAVPGAPSLFLRTEFKVRPTPLLRGDLFPLRTLNIARIFDLPPVQASFDDAHQAVIDLLVRISALKIGLIGPPPPGSGADAVPDVKDAAGGAVSFDKIAGGGSAFVHSLVFDADPAGRAPGEVFSLAVRRTDTAVLILRRVEAYVAQRRALIAQARRMLAAVNARRAAAEARRDALDGKLAEARQDVAAARALRQDEQTRVDDVNQRRDAFIRDQVPFLAFVRPREIDLARRESPAVQLDSADTPSALPACLKRHDQPPEPLTAYIQLYRNSPVGWFPEIEAQLSQLDTRTKILSLLTSAKAEALRFVAFTPPPQFASAEAVTAAYQGSFALVSAGRRAAAGLDLARPELKSWIDHRGDAARYASLGDVIDGRHGQTSLARAASAWLNDVEQAATCLHAEFADVAPATRLLWVEKYSQFDAPAPLHDLGALPGFAALDRERRRRLQEFADWLFARVDNAVVPAVNLVNDLVRVCLLLASHAPVGQIITGHLPRVTPVRPGVLIPVRPANPALVRVGMEFSVWRGPSVVARGLVEDLREGEVSARVRTAALATLDSTMRVQFIAPRLTEAGSPAGSP